MTFTGFDKWPGILVSQLSTLISVEIEKLKLWTNSPDSVVCLLTTSEKLKFIQILLNSVVSACSNTTTTQHIVLNAIDSGICLVWWSFKIRFCLQISKLPVWICINGLQVDYKDIARRIKNWMKHGIPELGDFGGLGLGRTTATVLRQKKYEDDPHAVCTVLFQTL